jgi:kynureninase
MELWVKLKSEFLPGQQVSILQIPLFQPDRGYAQQLDRLDVLAPFRAAFHIAEPELLYLDGNSLGRLPRRTLEIMQQAVRHQWGERLIRSWGEGWYSAPQRIGDKIGLLVGAAPGQVIVGDSTSVNLYKLVMAALSLRPERSQIITDAYNFPTDIYILQGCIHTLGGGYSLQIVDPGAASSDPAQAILSAIDENTALVTLSHVVFKSGYLYDAAAITRRAHEMGALVLWDLSHAAGAVPVALDAWNVDFAVGCTYKYLNGGPGAPAFLYVREDLQDSVVTPIWGWFSEQHPFAFDLAYHPARGISRFLCGTPPVISLLGIESGVDLLLEAGMERLREKSIAQTEYLIQLFDHALAPLGFTLGAPREPARRGSHIALRHAESYRINRALIEQMNIIPDFREPDNIRLGIAPIYTRYEDIWETVQRIAAVVKEERYKNYPSDRLPVT